MNHFGVTNRVEIFINKVSLCSDKHLKTTSSSANPLSDLLRFFLLKMAILNIIG